jgi:3-hydroxybutyryl-CoA dehydratase
MEERKSFVVGQESSMSKTVSDEDIRTFARISGDVNPLHLDDEYARSTMFGGRIAHGMLVASLISAVIGTCLPGPGAIYMGQELRFVAPVRPGDTITAIVRVEAWDDVKGRVTLATEVRNQNGETVVAGMAKTVMARYLQERK